MDTLVLDDQLYGVECALIVVIVGGVRNVVWLSLVLYLQSRLDSVVGYCQ